MNLPSDVESDDLPPNVGDTEADDEGSEADPDMPPLDDMEDPGELPPDVDESGDDAKKNELVWSHDVSYDVLQCKFSDHFVLIILGPLGLSPSLVLHSGL